MEIRSVLARCTAHGATFGGIPGGIPEITPADIAHGVGRVRDRAGQALVLYLWAGQTDLEAEVMRLLLRRVSDRATERRWRVRQPGTLTGLVRAVLKEMRQPRQCTRCNGSGTRAGKPCAVCLGEGGRAYTDRMRARAAGLEWSAYQKWAGRYPDVYGLIEDIEREAVRDIRRALT